MIFALLLLYQTTAATGPTASDVSQSQTQTTAASGAAANKSPEKPPVVCRKEYSTGSRVRAQTVCTTNNAMAHSQADFQKSLSTGALAPMVKGN